MVSDSAAGRAGRGLPSSAGSRFYSGGGGIGCAIGTAGGSAGSAGTRDTAGFATAGGCLDMASMKATTLEPRVEVERVKDLTVCLVGMPNAGKTTLMNALTGG